jgi:hypothetical protein
MPKMVIKSVKVVANFANFKNFNVLLHIGKKAFKNNQQKLSVILAQLLTL